MSQVMSLHGPTESGPFCSKCGSKMKLSHVTLHQRVSVSFERHTFVCPGCGNTQTYTLGNVSRPTSSRRRPTEFVEAFCQSNV
jgi:hypothetical protein